MLLFALPPLLRVTATAIRQRGGGGEKFIVEIEIYFIKYLIRISVGFGIKVYLVHSLEVNPKEI